MLMFSRGSALGRSSAHTHLSDLYLGRRQAGKSVYNNPSHRTGADTIVVI